ncbi:hypothetical protein K402DRAFT_463414 [Aulographum hederae CBS 113979]|uniref:YDG domain-containing protein n=1 Tax=Aulographum hederae CBS 113979 TaxID=1176131 RepID=A0A6G1H1I0_9PEZI|nr:hypothetical protein K402DRAFT_463414 [Aulographum hederae CBS 113979]
MDPSHKLAPNTLLRTACRIRDTLDPIIAREGPEILHPNDVLALHEIFQCLLIYEVPLATILFSRIHLAIAKVAGQSTRWPAKLADICDDILILWKGIYGDFHKMKPPLYEGGGRLEGIGSLAEDLIRRWEAESQDLVDEHRARHHGSLGLTAGMWWIDGVFAFRDGVIDSNCIDGGICFDTAGAYAIVLHELEEMEGSTQDVIFYQAKKDDVGRYKLTSADFKSRYPLRIFRTHKMVSFWAPVVGVRYEGLYTVTGWKLMPRKVKVKFGEGNEVYLSWEVTLTREPDQVPMEQVTLHPISVEIDDYVEYQRSRNSTAGLQKHRRRTAQASLPGIGENAEIHPSEGLLEELVPPRRGSSMYKNGSIVFADSPPTPTNPVLPAEENFARLFPTTAPSFNRQATRRPDIPIDLNRSRLMSTAGVRPPTDYQSHITAPNLSAPLADAFRSRLMSTAVTNIRLPPQMGDDDSTDSFEGPGLRPRLFSTVGTLPSIFDDDQSPQDELGPSQRLKPLQRAPGLLNHAQTGFSAVHTQHGQIPHSMTFAPGSGRPPLPPHNPPYHRFGETLQIPQLHSPGSRHSRRFSPNYDESADQGPSRSPSTKVGTPAHSPGIFTSGASPGSSHRDGGVTFAFDPAPSGANTPAASTTFSFNPSDTSSREGPDAQGKKWFLSPGKRRARDRSPSPSPAPTSMGLGFDMVGKRNERKKKSQLFQRVSGLFDGGSEDATAEVELQRRIVFEVEEGGHGVADMGVAVEEEEEVRQTQTQTQTRALRYDDLNDGLRERLEMVLTLHGFKRNSGGGRGRRKS